MHAVDILTEAHGRLPDLVEQAVRGLTPEQLRQAPAGGGNTIAWLVWHLARVQDSHLQGEQTYVTGGWAERFGLAPDSADTGYGHTAEQVAAVAPTGPDVLTGYHAAVHERFAAYLRGLADSDLDKVVDENWDPPVTLGVRLVSIIDDDVQHAGQAAYVRGLIT